MSKHCRISGIKNVACKCGDYYTKTTQRKDGKGHIRACKKCGHKWLVGPLDNDTNNAYND